MFKTKIAVAVLATAACGSVALGGIALAGIGDSGGAGIGGTATDNCVPIGVNVLSGLGVIGQGTALAGTCAASAQGIGGHAN